MIDCMLRYFSTVKLLRCHSECELEHACMHPDLYGVDGEGWV